MLMEEIQPQDYKLMVDMDGVLADFIKGVNTSIEGGYIEGNNKQMWKDIKTYSENGGRLWAELEPMPDAMELWNYVKQFNPEILTSAGNPAFGADVQKHEWVKNHIGNVKVNIVRKSAEKAGMAAPNIILIDDLRKSIDPWVAAGGIGILHTSAKNTIAELKKLGL